MKRVPFLLTSLLVIAVLVCLGWLGLQYSYHRGYQVTPNLGPITPNRILNRSSGAELTAGNHSDPSTIVLITLDTTRADRLSVYGYPGKITPNLEEFATGGVLFNRAYAAMPTTSPSHATMMTSLYPLQHRLMKNGQKMRSDVLTLAEVLREEGYRTAGFVSTNRHFGSSGVARGFETLNQPESREEIVTVDGSETRDLDYRPARRTLRQAKEWIESNSKTKKVFIWVHFFDPHTPYVDRSKLQQKLARSVSGNQNRWVNYLRTELALEVPGKDEAGVSARQSFLESQRRYDAEVRYMDKAVGSLLDSLQQHREGRRLTMVVGDHGEGLGNHNWWGHGKHLYNEQVRIPLIVRFPDGRYAGREIRNTVEANDLYPTVLRAVDLDSGVLNDRDLPIEGKPLQLAGPDRSGQFGYAFLQRRQYDPMSFNKRILYRIVKVRENWFGPRDLRNRINYEFGQKYALVGGGYKYIHSTMYRDQFYDLKTDFYEQNNRLLDQPELASRYAGGLKDLIQRLRNQSPRGTASVDQEIRKKLEGLGYVN
ncbi:MAG: sulfatase [bacterium]